MLKNISDLSISVVIPTLGRTEPLEKCLRSLEKQTYKNFEVVIIDGEKNSLVPKLLKNLRQKLSFKYDIQKKKGFVNAVREGLDLCSGDIFLRTDDDIIATPQWLSAIIASFRGNDKIGGVTGPTSMPEDFHINRDLTKFTDKIEKGKGFLWQLLKKFYFGYILENKPFSFGRIYKSGALSLGAMYPVSERLHNEVEVDYLESSNWAVRRELIHKVGNLDELYDGVGEYAENEVTTRIKRMGYKLLFNPNARIRHCPSRAGVYAARGKTYSRMINFQRYYFRHIKPDTLDKFFRFWSYVFFQNAYYVYRFWQTKQISFLECFPATVTGFTKGILGKFNSGCEKDKR